MEVTNLTNQNVECRLNAKPRDYKNPLIGTGENYVVIDESGENAFNLAIVNKDGEKKAEIEGEGNIIDVAQSYVDMGQNPDKIFVNGEKLNYEA